MPDSVVIVGAGQGGLQVAESLRSGGYKESLILLGDESHLPYQRPPLSKGLLLGKMEVEQLNFRQRSVFERKQIDLRLQKRVVSLDRNSRTLGLGDGSRLAYHKLVLATGARPRSLQIPGTEARGIHMLRTIDDTNGIANDLATAQRVVVIGGGFIGLEMAAVARQLGKQVTVIEAAERLMARVVTPEISAFYLTLHEQQGCRVMLNCGVHELVEDALGKVCGLILDNGDLLNADLVVLGVGVKPNDELAAEAGIECDRGIITDANGRTNDPHVYGIGDCAAQRMADGTLRRLESVQNAVESAKACAAAILGQERPFTAPPWFWSDQYDIKLQMVGSSQGCDEAILRGDLEDRQFSYCYFKDDALVAMDSINRPTDHMLARKLLAGANSLTAAQAADPDFDLKAALD
jgi:3-phenylpropionate/trans-cinnamate dioxygenase ferredoxin reductase subunit